MLTALDHIIIGVHDLEHASQTFHDKLGLEASGGGIHPSGGTANRIIVIGDTYLELITIRTPAEAQPSMLARLQQGDGYVNFVLASDAIVADSQAMQARGITIVGPNAGELRSADGQARAWQRTDIERPDMAQRYPFIIQHDSTGEERRQRLAGWRTPPQHPLGTVHVLSATIAVADLTEASHRYQQIYGLQPSTLCSGTQQGWNDATLITFPLGAGTQHFELAAPQNRHVAPTANPFLPAPGALAHHLQRHGESLCRITLTVPNLASARRYLDEHNTPYTYHETNQPTIWLQPDQLCGATITLQESYN